MEILPRSSVKTNLPRNRVIVIRNETSSLFARELVRQEEVLFDFDHQQLGILKEKLDRAGDNLEREPSFSNYCAFRDLIGKFAKTATSIAYRVEKRNDRCGQTSHEVVSIINREADALYHLVMQRQQDRISIASKIASIKGMIIELLA